MQLKYSQRKIHKENHVMYLDPGNNWSAIQSFSDGQLFFGSEGITVVMKSPEMLGAAILKAYLEYISQHFEYLVLCACFQLDSAFISVVQKTDVTVL